MEISIFSKFTNNFLLNAFLLKYLTTKSQILTIVKISICYLFLEMNNKLINCYRDA